MTSGRRWTIVVAGLVLLVATPFLVQALPVHDAGLSAETLLTKARKADTVPYSGYVESTGTLRLPVSSTFSDVANLFGEKTTMRVWFRDADDWRVDKIGLTGETDLVRGRHGTQVWDFERNRVSHAPDAQVRLPQASDLTPPQLAARVLSDAKPGEVSVISGRRVAGVSAAGLRLSPSAPQSSIDHVDLWIDPPTGLALQVDIVANGQDTAALSSRFLDVSFDVPPAALTRFIVPANVRIDNYRAVDIADAADQFSPIRPPRRLAGLPRQPGPLGAVGVYGRGVTFLIAIPLWDHAAQPLRDQLIVTPGTQIGRFGSLLAVAPLNLLLMNVGQFDNSWLIAGTVTAQTLRTAAAQLVASPLRLNRHFVVGGG